LSELLSSANDREPLTYRERAKRIGDAMHFSTISRYQSGDHPDDPPERALRLLAAAYGLSYREVQQAAGVKVGAGPYQPPEEAARLTRQEQDAITHLIKVIAASKGGPDENVDLINPVAEQTGTGNELATGPKDRLKRQQQARRRSRANKPQQQD
jgi:hypothetical protein